MTKLDAVSVGSSKLLACIAKPIVIAMEVLRQLAATATGPAFRPQPWLNALQEQGVIGFPIDDLAQTTAGTRAVPGAHSR